MTIASSLLRRRRVLLLCVASVLLHYLTINWVSARIGMPAAERPDGTATIVAELHAPPAPVPVPAPAPAARPKPVPKAPPEPAPPPEPDPEPEAQAGAPSAEPAVQSATPAEPEAAEVQAETARPAREGRRMRASVPPSSELALDVSRTDAGGAKFSGVGSMRWTTDGQHYSMQVEAGLNMVITRLNLIVTTSEGAIGEGGFEPREATEKRRGRSQTATHFNREQGTITFSASPGSVPLVPGAQDKATLPLQLAAMARADPGQFDAGIDILVGDDKDATVYRFLVVGKEEIETSLGSMVAWHLSRPPRPGAYSAQLDIWLAPRHGWYPVQIRNTEANGAVTTQTVSKITLTESGK
jgi:hypothetical protein